MVVANGLLLVDKPIDLTSHDVVGCVRKILKQKSVGHTGTLDPMATGLMVLVLGEATKLSDFLTFSEKVYRLTAKLGVRTDSYDATGKVTSETAVDLPLEKIRETALSLQGDFDWPVPIFSAAKVDGKKLYEYARQEKTVALPIKRMNFSEVSVEDVRPTTIAVTLRCSKGSFIRSWCAELGERLGVGAHMEALSRLEVGPYTLEQAVTLDQLEADPSLGERAGAFISMSQALPQHRSVRIPSKEQRLLMNGQIPRDLANRLIVEQKEALRTGQTIPVKILGADGELISILVAQPGQGLKIRRVFRLDPPKVTQ